MVDVLFAPHIESAALIDDEPLVAPNDPGLFRSKRDKGAAFG